MKTILLLLFLSLGYFAQADKSAEVQCTIENYKDFIDKPGLHVCNLRGADLTEEDFRETNLIGAQLQMANLQGADLTGADLQMANLQGADLTGADLRETSLPLMYLFKAILIGAKVTQAQAEYLRRRGFSGFVVVE